MTDLQIIKAQLNSIEKKLNSVIQDDSKDWISQEVATEITGWDVDSLRKKRADGTIKKYKKNMYGKEIKYSRKELNSFFTEA